MPRCPTTTFLRGSEFVHWEDRYCPDCDKAFSRPSELRRHRRDTLIHNSHARRHPCPMCNKCFTQKSNLPEHLRRTHGMIISAKEQKIESCDDNRLGRFTERAKRRSGTGRRLLSQTSEISESISIKMEPMASPSLSSRSPSSSPLVTPSPEPLPSVQVLSLDTMQPLFSKTINTEVELSGFESLFPDSPHCGTVSDAPSSFEPLFIPLPASSSPDEDSELLELVRLYFSLVAPQEGPAPFGPPSSSFPHQQPGQGFNLFPDVVPEPFPKSFVGNEFSFGAQQSIGATGWDPTNYEDLFNLLGEQPQPNFFDHSQLPGVETLTTLYGMA